MTALKCPNPSCPFLFDPSQVPPGSVLACPQCGMRFTLGNTAPAAPHGAPAESATMTLGAAPQFAGSATSGMPPAAPGFDSPSANPTLSYGQPPASYPGQPTNTFGGPPAAPPGYAPPPGYGAPPGYAAPPGYGAPPPGYGAPPPGYGAPPPGYGPPSQLPSGSVQPVAPPPPPPAPPRAPRKSGGGGIGSVLLVGFAAVVISGTVLGLIAFGVLGRGPKAAGSNRYDELNLLYDHPDKKSGWAKDENLMGPLNMFLAYSRVEPDAAIVFGGKDTKTRDPRPAELEEGVDGLLRRKFNQVRRDDAEMAGAKWLGQPCALAYSFTAVTAKQQPTDDEVKVRGECYAVAHKGVAVWTVAWAPEGDFDGQLAAFAEARGRLRFNTLRDTWAPSAAATKTFRGQTPGYRVLDTDAVWAYPDPKKHPPSPPDADLYLRYDLKVAKGADMRKFAELEVTAVDDPGGEDPLELAVGIVEKRYNINPDAGKTTLEDLTDEVKGETSANPPEGKTPTRRFRTKTIPAVGPKVEDKSRTALVVVSGIKAGEKLIVLEARCPEWNNREMFEAALVKIAATLQEAK